MKRSFLLILITLPSLSLLLHSLSTRALAPSGRPRDMSLNIDPPEASFPAAGGTVTAKVISTSESRLAFKVKTSNNECYRVKPVFGFIEPKADAPLEIMRLSGPPKDDKLVVQWAEVPAEETDPKAPFAAGAQQGEVILPLKAA